MVRHTEGSYLQDREGFVALNFNRCLGQEKAFYTLWKNIVK